MKPRRRLFPRTLKECLEPALAPACEKFGPLHARIIRDWAHIAGAELARCTLPAQLYFPKGKQDEGTLTLQVHPAFALAVQHQTPLLTEKLAVYFGYRAIARIKLEQTLLTLTEQPKAAPCAAQHAPAAPLPDDPLQAALMRLAQAMESR